MGSAKSPELCRHRNTSSHARDGLPCLQKHHGQYISKEELANKKGGSESGFKQIGFRFGFFPQKSCISPIQLLHSCLLSVTLEMPRQEAELPPASSAQFAFTVPKAGRRERAHLELPWQKAGPGTKRAGWLVFPHQWPIWGRLPAFIHSRCGKHPLLPGCPHHQNPANRTALASPAPSKPLCLVLSQPWGWWHFPFPLN